jgi:hypothetical protein
MKQSLKSLKWLLLYSSLSMGDFLLTSILLVRGNGQVYESNVIAAAWLDKFGWTGFAVFKLTATLVFVGACCCVAFRRPFVARKLATLGCCVVGGVLIYSSIVLFETKSDCDNPAQRRVSWIGPLDDSAEFTSVQSPVAVVSFRRSTAVPQTTHARGTTKLQPPLFADSRR